jgi:hypothetical protein
MTDMFHPITLDDEDGGPYIGALVTRDGMRVDDDSAFLVAVCAVLGPQDVESLDDICDLVRRVVQGTNPPQMLPDHHEIATVTLQPDNVTVRGHYVDRRSVDPARFLDLLAGWRRLLAATLFCDVERSRADDRSSLTDGQQDIELWWDRRHATATITAKKEPIRALVLSDGALTSDRETALADLPARRDRDRSRIEQATQRLLAADLTAGRPTPARVNAARRLGEAGVLSCAVTQALLAGGRLGDVEWAAVCELLPYAEPECLEVERWTISADLDGTWASPPSSFEPLRDGAGSSPKDLLQSMTDALIADGWKPQDSSTLAVPEHELVRPVRTISLVRERDEWSAPWT